MGLCRKSGLENRFEYHQNHFLNDPALKRLTTGGRGDRRGCEWGGQFLGGKELISSSKFLRFCDEYGNFERPRYGTEEEEELDPNSVRDRLVDLEARVQKTEALLGQPLETPMLDVVNVEISVLKRVTGNAVSDDGVASFKLRVARVSDVETVSMKNDVAASRRKIDTWEALDKELKEQFPCAICLGLYGSPCESRGIQGRCWAQAKLRRQCVKDLLSTFADVDSLVDFNGIEVQCSKNKQKDTGREVDKIQAKLNALIADTDKGFDDGDEVEHFGGIQLVNTMQVLNG
ncbi:hypothetical protein BUALT_Bualt05G0046000 [Buddleja alternifolia]|uniref:Uncharacterized protein n=1 Tax=Buddleja alternifolia TaxID=168488 RepID=A0AAV6XI59_9LAMI|nr:hypothetical protein BUALT_Bualt05G0046000 [Buddleja alternifolia]